MLGATSRQDVQGVASGIGAAMGWVVFATSNNDYLWWVQTYPHGWVVNSWASPSANDLTLHHASCANVADPGTTYVWGRTIKICALDRDTLQTWAVSRVGPHATLPPCGACMWRETANEAVSG